MTPNDIAQDEPDDDNATSVEPASAEPLNPIHALGEAMEIHAPHKPILSAKEAAVHLAIVTVGILIALSFEGIRQWFEHRALVAEAHENITNEIRDNKKELEGFLASVGRMRTDLEGARDAAQALLDGKPLPTSSVRVGFNFPSLTSASRTTAEVTGAFGLMGYEEVKRYELTYSLQNSLTRLQNEAISGLMSAMAGAYLLDTHTKPTTRELEDWKQSLTLAVSSLTIQEQLAQQLKERYDEALVRR